MIAQSHFHGVEKLNLNRRHEYQMPHQDMRVPLLNIQDASQACHLPMVLAKMDHQLLPLSIMQNHVDLFYMLNPHHLQIADHLIFDSIMLSTLSTYELLDKHRHFLGHMLIRYQLTFPSTAPSELCGQLLLAHKLVVTHLMRHRHR